MCVLLLQALTTLKQKVRKYNKEFETEIESFRENPINSEDERDEAGQLVYILQRDLQEKVAVHAEPHTKPMCVCTLTDYAL